MKKENTVTAKKTAATKKPVTRSSTPSQPKMYNTINEKARILGLSSKYLRKLLREGQLPGVYCGTRYMVNYPETVKALSMMGTSIATIQAGSPQERVRQFDRSEKVLRIPSGEVNPAPARSRVR